MAPRRILLVGNRGGTNVGACFEAAALELGHKVMVVEPREAWNAPRLLNKFNWWLRGRRPTRLRQFNHALLSAATEFQPDLILVTGINPPDCATLHQLGEQITTVNYLTDDPWNPAHIAPWFLQSLPAYHHVFSTKTAVLDDLQKLGCRSVSFLPFAYSPSLHFSEPPSAAEQEGYASDVMFAGGADSDRIPYLTALVDAGFKVALYGDYWGRYRRLRSSWRGHADPKTLRQATAGAKVALCLVRRANRDGHGMRSFEIPAIGACMLAEDSPEHRMIFGGDGECTFYFNSIEAMLARTRFLLGSREARETCVRKAADVVKPHTYSDRFRQIIGRLSSP